jgi:hypothetical protein
MRVEVDRLQIDEAGVVDALVQARTMRRTVEIASVNMAGIARAMSGSDARVAGPWDGNGQGGAFAADQRMAAELEKDLDDEAVYLELTGQRARSKGQTPRRGDRQRSKR